MGLAGCEVVVVGAGIAGLAAATALAQRRARVTVLEQAPALGEVGAGLQVGPNSVAVLESLGLRDACEPFANAPEAIELRDYRAGALVARVPLGAEAAGRYGRPYWQFHRADLLGALIMGAAEVGVEIRLGVRVVGVAKHATGVVLRCAEGVEVAAQIAIGADGIRSMLRDACFGARQPRFTGHVAWRGLVAREKLPAELFDRGTCVTMGPGRHIVTYPLRGGTLMNFVAVEERPGWVAEGWTQPDDPAHLRAAFDGWDSATRDVLAAVEHTFLWGLFDHAPLRDWVVGRVALIGDACHPMLPFLAQGAAMGLEDAWVLAAELDVAETPEQGLRAYESRRRARATRVQRAAARNGRLYHLGNPVARGAAHLGLRAVSAVAPGMLLGKFDWLYGVDVVSGLATQ